MLVMLSATSKEMYVVAPKKATQKIDKGYNAEEGIQFKPKGIY